jgi:hypothetical protein
VRIVRTLVLPLLAAATLAAGCGTGDDGGGSTPEATKSLSPTEQLAASTRDFATKSHKYALAADQFGAQITGAVDAPAKMLSQKATLTVETLKITFDVANVGGQHYVKVAGIPVKGVTATKWQRIDTSRLTSIHVLLMNPISDPTGAATAIRCVVSAEKTGPQAYKGVMDLTKGGDDLPTVNQAEVAEMGDKGKAVPFEAALDADGRLSTLKLSLPPYGDFDAGTVTMTFSAFGEPVKVDAPPAGETVDAPPALYEFLNET